MIVLVVSFQIAGMTSKLFEHPFDLGSYDALVARA
jgi:hypothetical protein